MRRQAWVTLPSLPKALVALAALCWPAICAGADDHPSADCAPALLTNVAALTAALRGSPYLLARRRIVMAGWSYAPAAMTSGWRQGADPASLHNGQELPLVRAGVGELDACAIDRDTPCLFDFVDRSGDRLQVLTSGESDRLSDVAVRAFRIDCRFRTR